MRYNRKFLFGLLALGFLLSACTQTPEQRAKDATVLIIAAKADSNIGSGSGFFLQPDKIATNIHVVAGAKIVFAVGTKKVYNIEKVTGYNPERDLVVLQVSGEGKPFELGEAKKDELISAVGYPGGGYKVTAGTVHGIRKSDGQLRFVPEGFPENRETLFLQGNSGGPVLNSEGKVIGVVTLGDAVFGDAITVITSSELNPLLNSSNGENLSDWQNKELIRAHVYQMWGTKNLISNNNEEAVKSFDKALKLYKSADAYEKLGIAKHGLGQYQEAIKDYNEAIDLITDNFTAYYNRAFAKLKSGDYTGAIQDCEKVVELNSDYAEVYLVQGPAKEAKLDYKGAIKDYSETIDNLNPREPWHYYNYRGDAKREIKDYDGAIKDYDETISAIEDYDETIRLKDNLVRAYFYRGVAKAEMSNHKGAIDDYKAAIKLNSTDPNPSADPNTYKYRGDSRKALGQHENAKTDYAKAHYYWGVEASNSGDYQSAIEKFDEAIALDPNYVEAYHYRSDVYRLRGQKDDYPKAIADYDKVVALKPGYTEIHVIYNNRGLAKVGLKNYDEALDDYTKAIESKSNYAEAHYNQGDAYRLRGQKDFQNAIENFEEAEKNYTTVIDLKADFPDAYHKRGLAKEALGQNEAAKLDFAMAYYLWGEGARQREQYQKAIKNFNTSLELEPDSDIVYYYRGTTKAELGKSKADLGDLEDALPLYQAAIEDYDEAIKLDPEEAVYYRNRGVTKFRCAAIRNHNDHNGMIKDCESVIEDFTKTFKRKSDFMQKSDFTDTYELRGEARCLLGYAKANQGNSKEARKHYNLALQDFKEANKSSPDNASYHLSLGLANAALGKAKAARNAFEKAKQLKTTVEKQAE